MKDGIEKNAFSSVGEILNVLFANMPKKEDLKTKEDFLNFWPEVCGKKLAKYTRAVSLTEEGVLTVKCENSAAANELMLKQSLIFNILQRKASENEIKLTKIVRVYG